MQPSAVERIAGYTPLQTGRLERKCQVEDLTMHQIQSIIKLHPKLFHSPYPPRFVNNLYLDTNELDNYFANVFGYPNRRKVRIRWYGELFGETRQPVLEIKIKEGMVGQKRAYPLSSMRIDHSLRDEVVQQIIANSDLPLPVRLDLKNLRMILINRYYRHYYVSEDRNFRVTLDTDLSYFKANYAYRNPYLHSQKNYSRIIVEIKYDKELDGAANRVINYFPFRITRSSKYVEGVERVYH
jgi:SPX domain protein involved in polyphosphate accumulation